MICVEDRRKLAQKWKRPIAPVHGLPLPASWWGSERVRCNVGRAVRAWIAEMVERTRYALYRRTH